MKKVFVILAVLILLTTSVFGAEKIKLQSFIESRNPMFVLYAGLSPDSFDTAASDEEAGDTLGWETIEKSIKSEDVVVYFQIAQKGTAKKYGEKYSLTIEASEMILEFNEDGSVLAPGTEIYRTTKGAISSVAPVNYEKSKLGVTSETTTKDSATILAEYNGVVEDGTPIALFAVTWAKDKNAPDGIYQASVILRVSPL